MKTEVYTCDICKQSKSISDLSSISVNTRGITISENKYHADLKFDICKECLKKHGFVVNPKDEDKTEEEAKSINKKTLESKLLDILDDLGVQFYE